MLIQNKDFNLQYERIEYSEEQKCFHTCEIDDILDYPEQTTYKLLGIVLRPQAIEFTDGIWKLSEKEGEINITIRQMEFLFGVYMIDKTKVKEFYTVFRNKPITKNQNN